jgi:hypothetical protein
MLGRAVGAAGVLCALAALGAASARAEGHATEERLRRLEDLVRRQSEEIERLREEVAAKRGAEAGATPPGGGPPPAPQPVPVAGPAAPPAPRAVPYLPPPPQTPLLVDTRGAGFADGGDLGGVDVGGYLTVNFQARSDRNSFVDLHRLVVGFDAAITEHVDFVSEIEIEHGGVHPQLDGELLVEQAVVRFHLCDAIVPKVGVLLIPFGRYNLHHDDPMNDFTVRPLTAQFLVPTGFGQPGLGVEGAVPFGRGHVLSYDAAVTPGYEDDFSTSRGVRNARQRWQQDNNEDKQVWGRVAVTVCNPWLDHLEIGASGTWARYDAQGDDDLTGWSVDALIRRGPFEVKGEYIDYEVERDANDPPAATRGMSGLWVEAGWHFMPCGLRRCRSAFFTETSHFTLAVRYQTLDLDEGRHAGTFEDDLEAWSVGLNYRITERSVFRVDHTWYEAETQRDVRELTASFSTYF